MLKQDHSLIILPFNYKDSSFTKLAIPYNENFAIVRTCPDHGWLVVLRKEKTVLIEPPSIDACCYFCALITLTCTDFTDRNNLNKALKDAFASLEAVIFQAIAMDEQRYKMFQNDELIGR